MCGITGFFNLSPSETREKLQSTLEQMSMAIAHRGPDDSGLWLDETRGIGLGFRRLAILDLSPTGHQPMTSADGRYVMVFNGEAYNFGMVRDELAANGISFRGTSDTEVLLAAICEWGLVDALEKFNGMFAFALWDRQENSLSLVRDRMGVKPLYYGWIGNTLMFGSELKSMRAHPAFSADIDRDALTLYLRHNYIPTPFSIYRGVRKLPPGSILRISSATRPGEEELATYWSASEQILASRADPFRGDESQTTDELEELLTDSIRLRMLADVPLGAFLSGGVDSSTIVALMQQISSQPVQTFSIGFNESGYDEAPHARAVAEHLGTQHTEMYISSEQARAVIPSLAGMYDEPFANPSAIPTFLVSQLARRHVTVSLSGDGGDELFGGYNRYTWVERIWRRIGKVPAPIRGLLANGIDQRAPTLSLLAGKLGYPNPADKVHKLADTLRAASPAQIYLDLVSFWKQPAGSVIGAQEPHTTLTDPSSWPEALSLAEQMMLLDTLTYLPDDGLVKVDRASMAASLEVRVPFVDDYRLLEFAWRLPLDMKIRAGLGKWILRQVLYKYVPKEMIERPKMGFGVPIDSWLRGPLLEWTEELISEDRLRREGFFQAAPIRQKWQEHLAGKRNWQYHLWGILMFQAWLENKNQA
ncbi:MAG: asparagine synthase (glutamine-hydrolyzing) [Anaerolineae bacterium]|nr:asparagine synthase (glutamine-hydrolyzing) [Anaerolineae bacterium]